MTSSAQRDRWRPVVSRRMVAVGVGVVLLVAGVAGAVGWRASQDGQVGARRLPGVPLQGRSGLRLLVNGDPTPFVLDVDTGDGEAGGDLVLSTVEPGRLIALTDVGSGVSHRLPWPSRLDDHVMGLVGGHPNGRLAHVAFYPALDGAEQTLDVWLLDLTTRRWQQLPDMPLRLAPSKPQLRWTADGRLLLLAGLAGDPAALVAVWRPGEPRVAVREVKLPDPERRSGFRFAIW